jgi:transcriptional regulator with XRE-family HTH domain
MSQRELARACGVPQSAVAQAESGRRDLTVDLLSRAAAVAGLRLALVDVDGVEAPPMDDGAVRDMGRRSYPAHLDVRLSEEGWWHGPERYSRPEPWYTFDRDRRWRDELRRRHGTPVDHRLPGPDDSPDGRRAERRRAALRRAADEVERRLRAGTLPRAEPWLCDCPPGCAELEDWQGPPRHTADCPCGCDPC